MSVDARGRCTRCKCKSCRCKPVAPTPLATPTTPPAVSVPSGSVGGGGSGGDENGQAVAAAESAARSSSTGDGVELAMRQLGAAPLYNSTPYAERGWCLFELGMGRAVLAHLAAARARWELPPRFEEAEQCRPKLTELTPGPHASPAKAPAAVMAELQEALQAAKFTGKADRPKVIQLSYNFDWDMLQARPHAMDAAHRSRGLKRR